MDIVSLITIIGTNLAVFALLSGLMIYLFTRLDNDVNKISSRLDGHASRIDQAYQILIGMLGKK